MLPSNYIPVNEIRGADGTTSGICFDTGIMPSNDLVVKGLFEVTGRRYVFGSRASNSTSAQNQFGFYVHDTSNSGSAVCFYNSQKTFTTTEYLQGEMYIENSANIFLINNKNDYVYDVTANSGTFTGAQSIYIGAMNNAGTPLYGTTSGHVGIKAVRFYKNGTLIADYCPVYKTDSSEYGLYDQVGNTFLANIGNGSIGGFYYDVNVYADDGGIAYIDTDNGGKVSHSKSLQATRVKVVAVPKQGYQFLNLKLGNTVISTEEVVYLSPYQNFSLTATFIKDTQLNVKMPYTLMGIPYGFKLAETSTDPNPQYGKMFATVKNFSIKEDALSKQTSIIECDDVPSSFIVGCPVQLMTPKGKSIYVGLIQSIEDKTIYCREIISMFDLTYIFKRYMNSSSKTIPAFIKEQLNALQVGSLADVLGVAQTYMVKRKYSSIAPINDQYYQNIMSFKRPILVSMPTHNASIENMEEYYQKIFNDYGYYIRGRFRGVEPIDPDLAYKGEYTMLSLTVEYNDEDILVLGDNVEAVSNVSVNVEAEHTTLLIILDGASTNFRACFCITNEGEIQQITPMSETGAEQYVAYYDCVPDIIYSDDSLQTLVEGNLVNGIYNHKITLDVNLSSKLFRLEDFDIGRRVNFYYMDKMYNSVITAKEFSSSNTDAITSIHLTLGKVRTKLTEKLNIGLLK